MNFGKGIRMTENNKTSNVQPHRMIVGNPDWYDIQSANQFNLLTTLGLKEKHYLLDIGCGSLRAGRLFIPYLLPGHYHGIEIQEWLIKEGIKNEIGQSTIDLKKPRFSHDNDFILSSFDQKFDFIIAHSIFSHTPAYEIRKCMKEAAKVMKPTSIFAATYWPGEVSSKAKSWMIRAEFRTEDIKQIVEDVGLVFKPIEWTQHDLQSWFLVLHKDNNVKLPVSNDINRMFFLEEQLKLTHEQLYSVRNHPWVRLGHKIKYAFVWITLIKQLGTFRSGALKKYFHMRYDYTKKRVSGWFK